MLNVKYQAFMCVINAIYSLTTTVGNFTSEPSLSLLRFYHPDCEFSEGHVVGDALDKDFISEECMTAFSLPVLPSHKPS